MVPALVRTAAAIHGCCNASGPPPVPATDIAVIAAPAVRPRVKRSTPAATVIAMEAGSSIRPVSTDAQALAETAVRRITTTLRTA